MRKFDIATDLMRDAGRQTGKYECKRA